MKRKIMLLSVIAVLIAVVCCGLVACNGKKSAAQAVKGEEVSEKEWDRYFDNIDDNDNWKMEVVEKSTGVQANDKMEMTTKTTIIYDKGKVKVSVKYDISGDSIAAKVAKLCYTDTVYYYDENDEVLTYYHENGDEVTSEEKNAPGADYSTYDLDEYITSTDYADYKYDKDSKGYVYVANTNILRIVKFRSSKLAAVSFESKNYTNDANNAKRTVSCVITYNGQTVKMP